jgi:hypothetical protein
MRVLYYTANTARPGVMLTSAFEYRPKIINVCNVL